MRISLPVAVAIASVLTAAPAFTQPAPRNGAALVHSEGQVYLDDRAVDATAVPSPLADGVVVRTIRGRAAVALKRGGVLLLEAGTSVRVLANGVQFQSPRRLAGSAIVASGTNALLIGCKATSGSPTQVCSGSMSSLRPTANGRAGSGCSEGPRPSRSRA